MASGPTGPRQVVENAETDALWVASGFGRAVLRLIDCCCFSPFPATGCGRLDEHFLFGAWRFSLTAPLGPSGLLPSG